MKKLIIIIFIIFLSSCGTTKKVQEKNIEIVETTQTTSLVDSTNVIKIQSDKSEFESLHKQIIDSADSIKISVTEEKTEDKTTTKKDIIIYNPVKKINEDLKVEKEENIVIVDSTSLIKNGTTESTSDIKDQELNKKTRISISWWVYLTGGIIIIYFIIKWTSGLSLKGILKKLLNLVKI